MNGQQLRDGVADDHETALSRIGSSKWVYALTGGEMDAEHVRAAAADDLHLTARTFEAWAADESDAAAVDVFAAVAERASENEATVAPDDHEFADSRPTYDALTGVEGTAARAGALLAHALVAEKTLSQMVGFFVGDADPGTANTFRDLKSDAQTEADDAVELLDAVCADEDDWAVAEKAAEVVVEATYDDYVNTLESMGVKPKNVC